MGECDDLNFLVHVDHAALHTSGDHGSAAGNGEDVLDRHQERLVGLADRVRNRLVDRVHQFLDRGNPLRVTLERLERRDPHNRGVLVEFLGSQQLADLHLDEFEQLLVVHCVGLVQRYQDVGHTHLTRQQNVLAGLGHRAVGGGDHQDRTVHLRGAGDHVLDVVGVARGVDVCVVPLVGLVLHVRDVDGDTALTLLGGVVDLVECLRLVQIGEFVVQDLGDSRGQGGLAVVNVTDGPDVDVGLGPLELRLRHFCVLLDLLVLIKAVLMFSVMPRS